MTDNLIGAKREDLGLPPCSSAIYKHVRREAKNHICFLDNDRVPEKPKCFAGIPQFDILGEKGKGKKDIPK